MDSNKIASLQSDFDGFAHKTDDGTEFWFARELQSLLGYKTWENFDVAIKRAIISCETAKLQALDHFREVTKMVELGSGAKRNISDYMLTRYACYLKTSMNAAWTKKVSAEYVQREMKRCSVEEQRKK